MPLLPAYSFFANSNLFLYIKKDTKKMGVFFGAEGEIPSARFCARRQAPGQRTVRRTVLTLSVCPFRISFFTSKKTPKKWVSILAQKERFPRLAFALADRHPDSEQSTGLF